MKFDQILSDLKNKIYHPVYLLSGEEPYYIDLISDQIEKNVLSESEKEFNQTVLYGKDVDVATIGSYAKRYPMMANYQVLIVKEAQEIKNIDEISKYLAQPLESTLLVLCYKYKKIRQAESLGKSGSEERRIF
jgi:DNA polymerase III subunit delta